MRVKPMCSKEEVLAFLALNGIADELVMKAVKQAERSHRYRSRDDGRPYLTQHIFPLVVDVYNYFSEDKDLRESIVIALLHDAPEDDPTLKEDRLVVDYGTRITEMILHLQKPRKNKQIRYQSDKHDEHLEFASRIKKAPRICQIIKLLDRMNNLYCTDASRNTQKYERFLLDTVECYLPLAERVDKKLAAIMQQEINRIYQDLHR